MTEKSMKFMGERRKHYNLTKKCKRIDVVEWKGITEWRETSKSHQKHKGKEKCDKTDEQILALSKTKIVEDSKNCNLWKKRENMQTMPKSPQNSARKLTDDWKGIKERWNNLFHDTNRF